MKSTDEQLEKPVQVRRYSDHPIVQKKVAEARKFLETADLSLLNRSNKKESDS